MYSSSRGKAKVRLLAIHTTEGIMSAKALKDFFDRSTAQGSSHASADQDGVLLSGAKDGYVDYALAAWTLRSGNPISDNIELCGFAKWKRADWLAKPKMLDACARWLAERSVARGVPLVKLSPKEVAAGKSGVIGHTDWTVGMSDGTHWDPGPDFPYDVVLAKAAAYANGQTPTSEEDDMFSDADRAMLGALVWMLVPEGGWAGEKGAVISRIGAMQAVLAQIVGIASQGADVDEKQLAAELAPVIAPLLADVLKSDLNVDGLTAEELSDAVDKGLRKVLGSLDAA